MNTAVAAAFKMTLKDWNNDKLSALNNAVTGFGAVSDQNIAFKDALADMLISATGRPTSRDALEAAMSAEILDRDKAGTFS